MEIVFHETGRQVCLPSAVALLLRFLTGVEILLLLRFAVPNFKRSNKLLQLNRQDRNTALIDTDVDAMAIRILLPNHVLGVKFLHLLEVCHVVIFPSSICI